MRHDNKIQVAFLAELLWSTLCKRHGSLTLKNETSILLEQTLKQISKLSQNWQLDIMQEAYSGSRRQEREEVLQAARAKYKSIASIDWRHIYSYTVVWGGLIKYFFRIDQPVAHASVYRGRSKTFPNRCRAFRNLHWAAKMNSPTLCINT